MYINYVNIKNERGVERERERERGGGGGGGGRERERDDEFTGV